MSKVNPGINPQMIDSHFTPYEKSIIQKLSKEWYVTSGGGIIELGNKSKYKYFLVKPTNAFQELFNIEREIIVVFSDYENFEPRTLDAFDRAASMIQELRAEKICSILISNDARVEIKVKELIKSDPEYQVIVPFTYRELHESYNSYFITNRFKEYFYSRDLFAFQSPLKKDLYFFGRTDLVHKLVNRHKSNESSGLFGLRKTGKTSIIFGIQRAIKNSDGVSVFLDCQNPSFHVKRWNTALKHVINELKAQNGVEVKLKDEVDYNEESAASSFEKDILKIHKKLGKNILLVFDEIEQISPQISLSEHWKSGNDFTLFWQTLRSLFQKHNNVFSYLIVGTNPRCVETAFINGVDNPIFNQVPYEYISQFDVPQTREMIKKIGQVMGLNFDETIYSKLTEDFGGHPFLIRNVCSAINKIVSKERPVRIDKEVYEKGKELFNRDYSSYIDMILSVLKEHYNDEYEMLKFLALGDTETFNDFSRLSKEYTNHLLGYNILDQSNNQFFFKIESVKQHLVSVNKYKKVKLSLKEKHTEISQRRNDLEPKLRSITRTVLTANFGENNAKQKILDIMGESRKSKYYSSTLKDVLNANKSEVYLEDIRKIIAKDWILFENIFGKDKEGFNTYMTAVNKYRADSHAKEILDQDMQYFRVCATKLENYIQAYL